MKCQPNPLCRNYVRYQNDTGILSSKVLGASYFHRIVSSNWLAELNLMKYLLSLHWPSFSWWIFFIRYLLKRAIKYMYVNVCDPALKYEPHCQGRQPMHSLTVNLTSSFYCYSFCIYRMLTRFKKIWRKRNLRFILHLLL